MRDFLFNFHTFVVGFVAAEFFVAWRDLLRDAETKHQASRRWSDIWAGIDWLQAFWSLLLFLLLVQNWWSAWIDSDDVTKNFVTFVLSLVSPTLFSVTLALLFKKDQPLEKVTIHRWQWFHFLVALLVFAFIIIELLTNLFAGKELSYEILCNRANGIRVLAVLFIGSVSILPSGGRGWWLWVVLVLLFSYGLFVAFVVLVPGRYHVPPKADALHVMNAEKTPDSSQRSYRHADFHSSHRRASDSGAF